MAGRIRSLRALASAVESPLRMAVGPDAGAVLNRLAARLDVRPFAIGAAGPGPNAFEQVAAARLGASGDLAGRLNAWAAVGEDLERAANEVRAAALDATFSRREIRTADGAVLAVYSGGVADGPVVVLVPACGMPIELCDGWIRALSRHCFVITWETRGLFGAPIAFDVVCHDVATQAADALAVMDHLAVPRGHLMGLCGGAVIALAAAAAAPDRFNSLSLWYGDFELGSAVLRTKHQRDLVRMQAMARESRASAAMLQKLFADPALLANVPRDVAHLVLYPYAAAELFYRYAILNGAIMETSAASFLAHVPQPTLIVTSNGDATVHPAGSRAVAEALARGTLHLAAGGDHLSLFEASPELVALALGAIVHGSGG